MLSIALLSPKGRLYRHRSGIFKRSLRYAPLTLPTLASLVPPEIEHRVTLFDEGIRDIPLDLDADIIGMTVITPTAPRSYWLADHFRARGVKVVLGGPHVTLIPEDAAPHADAIVVGYAEESWPRLLRDFASGQLQRRYDQIPNLSLAGLPAVRRDLVPRSDYVTTDVFEATRACAHDCDFCVVPTAWGRRQFQKPVEEVIDDIRRTGSRRLIFIDLNLTSDRRYAARLFEALIPLRVQWYGLATSLLAKDPELLALCARSGCRGLLIGLESISTAGLREVHKGFQDPAQFKELIAAFHRSGIAIQGCFVFGFDDDTAAVFERPAEFVVDARIDLPRFAILTPFPGTPLFKRYEHEGRLLTRNWELFDGQHAVFQPRHMSAADLMRGTEMAWKHVYRYRSIAQRIWRSPASRSVVIAANLGYRFYAHHLDRFYNCDWGLISRVTDERGAAQPVPAPAKVA
jgi:radical SAM superfamily enzyme YgiQ (UPF0313 family)